MNLLKTSNCTYYHPIYNRFPDRGLSRLSDTKGWYTIVESGSDFPKVTDQDGSCIASGLPLEEAIAKAKSHYVRKVFGVIFPPEIEKKGFEVWDRGINFDGSLYNLVDSLQRGESLEAILGSSPEPEIKEQTQDDKPDSPPKRSFSPNDEEPLPKVAICCETSSQHGDIKITGSTYLNVIRVEMQDDGTIVAVTDHWPTDPIVLGKSHNREHDLDMHLSKAHEKIVSLEKALKEQAQFNLEGIRKFEKMLQEKEDLLKEALSNDPHANLKEAKVMGYQIFWITSAKKFIYCPSPSWKYPAGTYFVLVDGNYVRGDNLYPLKSLKK